jgi:hypothetical protein
LLGSGGLLEAEEEGREMRLPMQIISNKTRLSTRRASISLLADIIT